MTKKNKTPEYIASAIVNLILIWVWSHLRGWLPFLTDSFAAVLPLFYISFAATALSNLIFLLYDNPLFKGLVKVGINLFSIAVMITMYFVFPFDFSAYSMNWDLIVRIIILVGIFGTALGTFVEFITIVFGEKAHQTK